MKTLSFLNIVLSVAAFHAATANAVEPQAGTATVAATQQIPPSGSQPSVTAPAEHFAGRVQIDPVWAANANINASGGLVTFEPGARTAWHTHPQGQYLMVTSGVGLIQEWGKPIRVIHPGDVVWCPPGAKHWHGAAPTTAMTHLAVTGTVDGKNVEWLEKVTDDQYNAR